MSTDQQIAPGISVTSSGQATVDPTLADVLFDLAIKLEERTNHPVDVEHVLAAIVLAARKGELSWSSEFDMHDRPVVLTRNRESKNESTVRQPDSRSVL